MIRKATVIAIVLFHNDRHIKYSFVLILISLSSLATTSKIQKNSIWSKMRAVGLINVNTNEWKGRLYL